MENILFRSRKIVLNLRWSFWTPPPRPWKGIRGVNFFEYILKYLSYDHNFFLAQRTRLKTPFTYLEHHHIANRKIFRAPWKKIWPQKRRIYQKFPAQFLLHFWDHRIRHFSFNIIRSVHRMVPIFYRRKELVQEYLLNTLNGVVKWKEKFLEAFEQRLYLHKNYHPSQL